MKVLILYQVIFHYRQPLYEALASDPCLDITVIHGTDGPGKNKNAKGPYRFPTKRIATLHLPFRGSALPVWPTLLWHLVKARPQVIVSEGTSNLANAALALLYARLAGARFVWWSLGRLEGRDFVGLRSLVDRFVQFLERASDAVITYSSVGRTYFVSRGVAPSRVYLSVNVVDTRRRLAEIRQMEGIVRCDPGVFQILFVGSIIREKRLELLIDAAVAMEKDLCDTRLVIVGDGLALPATIAYAARMGLKRVEFPGSVVEGISRYFLQSSVFVLPGLGGLAISDAMVHGLPIIAGIADGTEIDLVDAECGILDRSLDARRLEQHLRVLHRDRERTAAMGRNARRRVTEVLNYDAYINGFKSAITGQLTTVSHPPPHS